MAQSTLHFSFGMFVGSLIMLPRLWRRWIKNKPISITIGYWIIISVILGTYATIPGIIRRLFDCGDWAAYWWVNIFLFYPLIDKLNLPSIALGELCAASIFAAQYALILFAIYKYSRKP